jgi:hypothetical protein
LGADFPVRADLGVHPGNLSFAPGSANLCAKHVAALQRGNLQQPGCQNGVRPKFPPLAKKNHKDLLHGILGQMSIAKLPPRRRVNQADIAMYEQREVIRTAAGGKSAKELGVSGKVFHPR